jgi:hypothetical protein
MYIFIYIYIYIYIYIIFQCQTTNGTVLANTGNKQPCNQESLRSAEIVEAVCAFTSSLPQFTICFADSNRQALTQVIHLHIHIYLAHMAL